MKTKSAVPPPLRLWQIVGMVDVVGSWAYRETMTRPWPKVASLNDDDWDE
jgi:hypothetical protein